MSLIIARIRLILRERAGLKLRDLLVFLEKMPDDLESMRYTNAWTRTNIATFINMLSANKLLISIIIIKSGRTIERKNQASKLRWNNEYWGYSKHQGRSSFIYRQKNWIAWLITKPTPLTGGRLKTIEVSIGVNATKFPTFKRQPIVHVNHRTSIIKCLQ